MTTRNDILSELKELNSPLADAPRTMPYKVPQGYFAGLADNVSERVESTVDLDTRAQPYSLPEGYFEGLPEELLQKIKQAESSPQLKKKGTTLWLKNIRWAAAAILILAVGLGSYRILTPQNISIQQQLDEIPESVLVSYMQENADEFDTELLTADMNTINPDVSEVENEALESYLEGWQ